MNQGFDILSKMISLELSFFDKSMFKVLTLRRPIIFSGLFYQKGILVDREVLIFFIISFISSELSIE